MISVECPECQTRYSLEDSNAGKKVRCRRCETVFRAQGGTGRLGLRKRLRLELAALAAGKRKREEQPSSAARLHVTERRPTGPSARRVLLLGAAMLLLAAACGGGVWAYLYWTGPSEPQVPQQVVTALSRARNADKGPDKANALTAWQTARRVILLHRDTPDTLRDELAQAERRIQELNRLLRGTDPLERPEALLADARAALKAGRFREARGKAQGALGELGRPNLTGDRADALRNEARELLADPKLAEKPPAPRQRPARTVAATPPKPAAPTLTPQQRLRELVDAIRTKTQRGEPQVVVDAPSEFQRWHGESWANPVNLALEQAGGAGSAVTLRQQDGQLDKWVVSIDQPLDLSAYDTLTLEMEVREPLAVSVAIWTEPGSVIFESRTVTVDRGKKGEVSFPLKGKLFKSQVTNWQFGTEIQNPKATTRITLFIYGRSRDPIRIRNLRLNKNA